MYLKEISLDNRNFFNKCLNRVKGTQISGFGIILFQIKNTLKSKGSIDKYSVSSSRTEMMSLSSEVSMDIFIRFIYI